MGALSLSLVTLLLFFGSISPQSSGFIQYVLTFLNICLNMITADIHCSLFASYYAMNVLKFSLVLFQFVSSVHILATNGQQVVTEQVLEEQEQRPTPENMELGTVERAVEEFVDLDKSEDDAPDIALSSTAGADCSGLGEEVVAATSAEVIQENGDDDANQDDTEPWPERSPGIQLAPPDEDGGPEVSGPAPKTPAPLASKAHVFFFDRESQEEEPPQPACDPPFTQAQLEEAKQQMRYLMEESGQGLDSVTMALMKNSGDVRAALQYLRHGPQGCLWDPDDDPLLCSGGHFLRILEQKYGKAAVARRIYFLEIQ